MQNGGGYNNHKRSRHSQGGGGGNRQRRNYGAAREKYLAQARDALAAGDRVLAENYYQHADHCYRMMVEEGQFAPRQQQHNNQQQQQPDDDAVEILEDDVPENVNALPAFITANVDDKKGAEVVVVQDWEERDA